MDIKRLDRFVFQIKGINVDAIVYTDQETINDSEFREALQQIVNVTYMPGIVAAIAMPDIHWGYGFPIGGVGVFSAESGVISPGGIGFDINCGVRVLLTSASENEVRPVLGKLLDQIYRTVPVGVGAGRAIKVDERTLHMVCVQGAHWAVEKGYGTIHDLNRIEDTGKLSPADPIHVSKKAFERGLDELGTLGAGNHFIEIQKVERIFSESVARAFGIFQDQIAISIHCGSRGFGHQIATDYIQIMRDKLSSHNKSLPDKQLINAPLSHPIGQQYFSAMNCAANYAFANRQMIAEMITRAFQRILPKHKIWLLYDVAHNIAKIEKYRQRVIVHRKGATRSLGPGNTLLSSDFIEIGQPVLIPGSMGTASYILVGTKKAEEISYASTAHGAGRLLGRRAAVRDLSYQQILGQLKEKGIITLSKEKKTLVEEAPQVYKDVDRVVEIVDQIGISKKVARLLPLGVVKG
ncbi:MAG TPA: RtcB family protein [Pseudothermotoga sp.]|nr:RtcB family protein [Pseudothermotoga sp.]HOK82755.1 RtcB family protein [Pseudothermotoga sp.]HPP70807.1 RtcB family protein [Pseudothermotoga sp.]